MRPGCLTPSNQPTGSVFLLQTLQNAYPRLLRLVKDFFIRVRVIKGSDPARPITTTTSSTASLPSTPTSEIPESEDPEEALFLRSLSPLATAYIQRSATRLFDPINLAFPADNRMRQLPTKEDAERIVRVAAAELEQARFDPKLLRMVGKNVGKAAHAFAVKSEGAVNPYELAPNLAATSASQGLVANLDLLNALFVFEEGMWRVLEEYEVGSGLMEEVGPGLEAARKVAMGGIEPLFRAVGKELEGTMVKVHKEDYAK